jgi:hypothetical protein
LTQVFSGNSSTDARGEKKDARRRIEPPAIHNNRLQEHISKRPAIINHFSEMSRVFCTIISQHVLVKYQAARYIRPLLAFDTVIVNGPQFSLLEQSAFHEFTYPPLGRRSKPAAASRGIIPCLGIALQTLNSCIYAR